MAALRPCRPSGIVVGLGLGTSSLRPLGRASFQSLKTSRRRHAIGAHQGPSSGMDPEDRKRAIEEQLKIWRTIFKGHLELDKDMPFREDIQKIEEYDKAMDHCTSIFHIEATTFSLYFCMIASKGVKFASAVMESAALRFDNKQDEVSSCTTKQTLTMYVSIFVGLVKDAYDKKFNDESIFALLGAFRGVAAVGHILLQDTLANFNYTEYSSSNCGVVLDSERVWCEFEQKMNNLEAKFRAVSKSTKAYEILRPTMTDAMKFTMLYISAMVAYHEKTLGYVPGTKGRRRSIKASGDGEPGAFGTSSGSM